jgi:3-phytase
MFCLNSGCSLNHRVQIMPKLLLCLICFLSASAFAQVKPVAVTMPGNNVDSLAIWIAPNKADSLVLLTEKGGGQVMVFKADRQATFVRRFGNLKRPNGVAILRGAGIGPVTKDLVFVTDRDGNLVHIYSIPDFEPLGTFGPDIAQPMGISVYRRPADGAIFAYVIPKRGEGEGKVVRFRITEEQGQWSGKRDLQFGREITVGQETVMVDGARGRVLVADENARDIKVYSLDGEFRGSFGRGIFQAQVEGIVIAVCGDNGYIIASDQRSRTEFEFFDRDDFRHLGTVRGAARVTDGIALDQTPLPDFPRGLFAAQSDPLRTGGRHAEFYDFGQMLDALRPVPKKCLPKLNP